MGRVSKQGNAAKFIWRRGSHSLGGDSIALTQFPSQATAGVILESARNLLLIGRHKS
jgi:hypothetical protein